MGYLQCLREPGQMGTLEVCLFKIYLLLVPLCAGETLDRQHLQPPRGSLQGRVLHHNNRLILLHNIFSIGQHTAAVLMLELIRTIIEPATFSVLWFMVLNVT